MGSAGVETLLGSDLGWESLAPAGAQLGWVVGRAGLSPSAPLWQMAARHGWPWGALCPPSPLLDQAEANTCADGLTCLTAQTKPEPTDVALGLGPGAEAAVPAGPWPSGGPPSALHTGWSPQDMVARTGGLADRPGTLRLWGAQGRRLWTLADTFLVGTGLMRTPEVGGQSWARPGSQGPEGQLGPRI